MLVQTLAIVAALSAPVLATVPNSKVYKYVAAFSIDGLHSSDVNKYTTLRPASTIAILLKTGYQYTDCLTSAPSDSYPGVAAFITGASPRTHGIWYDDTYDRTYWAPFSTTGTNCAGAPGAEVIYDETKDYNSTELFSGGINPLNLPQSKIGGQCVNTYPHQRIRVNTIYEVVQASGKQTAYTDKHPSYDMVRGPSGKGLSVGYFPEIASYDDTNVTQIIEYDTYHVNAWLAWINGGSVPNEEIQEPLTGTPTLFGGNFQAVSVAQKSYGYVAGSLAFTPELITALDFVDTSLGKIVAALKAKGIYDETLITIASKHGQTPIDPTLYGKVDPALITPILGVPVAEMTTDDIALIFLEDQRDLDTAVNNLNRNRDTLKISDIISGDRLTYLGFGNPTTDPSVPDIIVAPEMGIIYTTSTSKIAEHGGLSENDRNVACLVSASNISPAVFPHQVSTQQFAPTILKALGLDPKSLQGSVAESRLSHMSTSSEEKGAATSSPPFYFTHTTYPGNAADGELPSHPPTSTTLFAASYATKRWFNQLAKGSFDFYRQSMSPEHLHSTEFFLSGPREFSRQAAKGDGPTFKVFVRPNLLRGMKTPLCYNALPFDCRNILMLDVRARPTPKYKLSRYRFLTWVAYSRTLSTEIDESQRLSCPLTDCPRFQKPFPTMAEMLEHVHSCKDRFAESLKSAKNFFGGQGSKVCQLVGGSRRHSRDSNDLPSEKLISHPASPGAELADTQLSELLCPQSLYQQGPFPEKQTGQPLERSELSGDGWAFELSANRESRYSTHQRVDGKRQSQAPSPLLISSYTSGPQAPLQQPQNWSPPSYGFKETTGWGEQNHLIEFSPPAQSIDEVSRPRETTQNMHGSGSYRDEVYPDHTLSPLTSAASDGTYPYPLAISPVESQVSSSRSVPSTSPTGPQQLMPASIHTRSSSFGSGYASSHYYHGSFQESSPQDMFAACESNRPYPTPAEGSSSSSYSQVNHLGVRANNDLSHLPGWYSPESVGQKHWSQPNNAHSEGSLSSSSPVIQDTPNSPTASLSSHDTSCTSSSKYKCTCGFEPRGKDINKPSNLKRHRKTSSCKRYIPYSRSRDPPPEKSFKCPFPDCGLSYTRSDNLLVHQRNKKHQNVIEFIVRSSSPPLEGGNEETRFSNSPGGGEKAHENEGEDLWS
ncbi:hypothetical protein G7Y89_g1888 [Cudoniella acicularis]|uniref:C2H2-type domain-containing protein n=1 Tax=Cudoniella acicularis TaxID=354080 RepID=A0A8H4RV66_9HELO|nr:hypothetical protein G7Y89_g1888 [Cudoniella acicularis]